MKARHFGVLFIYYSL